MATTCLLAASWCSRIIDVGVHTILALTVNSWPGDGGGKSSWEFGRPATFFVLAKPGPPEFVAKLGKLAKLFSFR
jgi:hypothetical protein